MSELIHHPAFWSGLFLLLMLAANLYVFLTREWEASHRAVDYARLFFPSDRPTIRQWRIDQDTFAPEIIWNRQPTGWELHIDGKLCTTLPGDKPGFKLTGDKFTGAVDTKLADFNHTYLLRPLPSGIGPDITLDIKTIDREFYLKRGMQFPRDIQLLNTPVPVGKFTRHPVSYWVDDYAYMGAAALAEADRLLDEEAGIQAEDTEHVRMEKIIHFLRTSWVNAGGVPKDDYRWMNPLQIFQELRDGRGKGWCTQNAQIFAFFANRAGVPTRFVYGATVQDNVVVYNGHSWNECYLSDQNRWVYVDPQAIVIGVFDSQGRALNSADVFHLCRHDIFDGITARTYKNWQWRDLPLDTGPDTATTVPFALIHATARKQFNEQTIIKYRRPPNVEDVRGIYGILLKSGTFAWTNFQRYFFKPDLAYSILPTHGAQVYRVRHVLLAGLMASVICFVLSLN
jgi:hypothetical protein